MRSRTVIFAAGVVAVLVLLIAGVAAALPGQDAAPSQEAAVVSGGGPSVLESPGAGSAVTESAPILTKLFHADWGTGPNEVGLSEDKVRGPSSFVIDDDNGLHVLDGVNGRILTVSPTGGVLGEVPIALATDPYDFAIAPDGSFVVYDPGTASFQAYSSTGELLSIQPYPETFYPGVLVAAQGTVFVSAGWEGPTSGFGYVPVWGDGALGALSLEALQVIHGTPLEHGSVSFSKAGDGQTYVRLIDGGQPLFEQEIVPSPSGPLYANRLTDGRLAIAADVPEDPDKFDIVLRHRVWIFDVDGSEASFDLGAEEKRLGYVHVEARVSETGQVYFLNTDSSGLTIWRASIK